MDELPRPPAETFALVTIGEDHVPSFWIRRQGIWREVTLVQLCDWIGDELPFVAAGRET